MHCSEALQQTRKLFTLSVKQGSHRPQTPPPVLPVGKLKAHVIFLSLGSRVVSVLDSGAEGAGFKSQLQRCRVIVSGKLLTPIVPLFTKQRNW